MSYLVFSCSLNPDSNSRLLAQAAFHRLSECDVPVEYVDLRDLNLPLCDGAACYEHPHAIEMTGKIAAAQGILLAIPIYNYAVSAATKNLLELTGSAWYAKTVGLLSAAGGRGSYMALMPFANSLLLDYRCLIVPRFIYAADTQFKNGALYDPGIPPRIADLCRSLVVLAPAYMRATQKPPNNASA